jgi:hypothetical protein
MISIWPWLWLWVPMQPVTGREVGQSPRACSQPVTGWGGGPIPSRRLPAHDWAGGGPILPRLLPARDWAGEGPGPARPRSLGLRWPGSGRRGLPCTPQVRGTWGGGPWGWGEAPGSCTHVLHGARAALVIGDLVCRNICETPSLS